MNKRYVKGFSIYELIVVIAILSVASPFIYSLISDAIERRKDSQYSDFTKMYASKFIDEIKSNYSEYYNQVTKDPNYNETIVIPFTKIQDNVTKSLNWGLLPCVALRYNPMSRDMQAIMFYTDNGIKAKAISKQSAIRAMNDFGVGSGYYESSGVVNGISGAWSLTAHNDYINDSVVNKCSTTQLTKNGLVINLNMLDSFPKVSSELDTGYLSRIKDNDDQIGDNDNKNTMQTDIMLQNGKNAYGIFFSGNESSAKNDELIFLGLDGSSEFKKVNNEYRMRYSYYGSKMPNIAIYGGGVRAESFIPMKEVDAYTDCSYSEYGSIVKQKKPDKSASLFDVSPSYLVCTNNRLVCKSGACYLPQLRSLHYKFNQTDNVTEFECPSNMYIEPGSIMTDSLTTTSIVDSEPATCFDGSGTPKEVDKGACSLIPYDTTIEYDKTTTIDTSYPDDDYFFRFFAHKVVRVSFAKYFMKVPTYNLLPSPLKNDAVYCNCAGKTAVAGKNGAPDNIRSGILLGVTCTTNPAVQIDYEYSTK